jgi:hypothetical protein
MGGDPALADRAGEGGEALTGQRLDVGPEGGEVVAVRNGQRRQPGTPCLRRHRRPAQTDGEGGKAAAGIHPHDAGRAGVDRRSGEPVDPTAAQRPDIAGQAPEAMGGAGVGFGRGDHRGDRARMLRAGPGRAKDPDRQVLHLLQGKARGGRQTGISLG